MPGYIAWVYVYGLASQLAQADGVFNRWNEEGFRQTYYDKLVAGVDDVIQDIQEEPEPEIHTFAEEEAALLADDEEGEEVESSTPKVAPMKAEPKAEALRSGRSSKV